LNIYLFIFTLPYLLPPPQLAQVPQFSCRCTTVTHTHDGLHRCFPNCLKFPRNSMQVIYSERRLTLTHDWFPKVAILITNQVQCQYHACCLVLTIHHHHTRAADPGATMTFVAGGALKPIGGHILSHASATRIFLRKGMSRRFTSLSRRILPIF